MKSVRTGLCDCHQWNVMSGLSFPPLMKQSVGPQTFRNYFKQHQGRVCVATSGHPDPCTWRLTWALLVIYTLRHHLLKTSCGNWYLCLPNVFLFLFLQIQYIQICFHCPGFCGDIYLHFHVSKAGGKNRFTNHLYSLLAMGPRHQVLTNDTKKGGKKVANISLVSRPIACGSGLCT